MLSLDFADDPFPEGKRLCMRIVDPEDAHSLIDPELKNTFQFFPQCKRICRFEVQRIYILISLWWSFRVLDRTVWTLPEPLGMLVRIGVIRRALERDAQRNFQTVFFHPGDKLTEILQSAQLRMNRLVTPLGRSNRPGTAHVVGFCHDRIIFPFAMSAPNRVNGCQIHDVEAHGSNVWEPRFAILQRAVMPGLRRARTWENF